MDHPSLGSSQRCKDLFWSVNWMLQTVARKQCKGNEAKVAKAAEELSELAKQVGELDDKIQGIIHGANHDASWNYYKNRRVY